MNDKTTEAQNKIREYLHVIEERILEPIEKTEISHYCTAVLLLLFAAIDGMGKLLHLNNQAGSNALIRVFLDYMSGEYNVQKEDLLNLRNALVHNAINVASFLSQVDMGSENHLKKIGKTAFVYVNTGIMYKDFKVAFKRFGDEIMNNPVMMNRAANRLKFREYSFEDLTIKTTPEPPVLFIQTD